MRHEPGLPRPALTTFHQLPVGASNDLMKLLSASCAAGARGLRLWCLHVHTAVLDTIMNCGASDTLGEQNWGEQPVESGARPSVLLI